MNHRRWLPWLLIVIGVMGCVLSYSLIGAMTGVYRFQGLDVIDPNVRGYLVWEQDHWACMMLSRDNKTIFLSPEIDKGIKISSGIWTREVTFVRMTESDSVMTPLSLLDVYLIRFARDDIEVTNEFRPTP